MERGTSDQHRFRHQGLFVVSTMSTPSHHATTTLPIHRPIGPINAAMNDVSSSQMNNLNPSRNTTTTSSANNHNPNAMDVKPTSIASQSIINPSAIQTRITLEKTRIKRYSEIFKDWHKMTMAERLGATTDLHLAPFSDYEWKIENELPCLSPWSPRQ